MLWKQTQGLQGWQKIGKDVRNSMKNEGRRVIDYLENIVEIL